MGSDSFDWTREGQCGWPLSFAHTRVPGGNGSTGFGVVAGGADVSMGVVDAGAGLGISRQEETRLINTMLAR